MKLIQNRGADRAIDLIRPHLQPDRSIGFLSPRFSLYAFAELRQELARLCKTQLVLPADPVATCSNLKFEFLEVVLVAVFLTWFIWKFIYTNEQYYF